MPSIKNNKNAKKRQSIDNTEAPSDPPKPAKRKPVTSAPDVGESCAEPAHEGRKATQEYIVDRLFPSGEVHLIGGPSGSGKTTLGFDMIDALQCGEEIFGRRSRPTRCQYIACDRTLEGTMRTLKRLGLQGQITHVDSLMTTPSACFDDVAYMLPSETQVLFIDGIIRLFRERDTNSYIHVAEFLSMAATFCQEHNLTIFGIVHSSKMRERDRIYNPRERILGSVAWAAFSETIIYIEPVELDRVTLPGRRVLVMPRNEPCLELDYMVDDRGRLIPAEVFDQRRALDLRLAGFPAGAQFSKSNVISWATESHSLVRFSDGSSNSLRAGLCGRREHLVRMVAKVRYAPIPESEAKHSRSSRQSTRSGLIPVTVSSGGMTTRLHNSTSE